MRCIKCGFISFDHLASCAKCGRDISEVASELQGTSIKVEIPMFLSGALAAFPESEESFDDHAMDAEVSEDIDFHMEMEEEAIEIADEEEDVDFSFDEEAEEVEVIEEAAGIEEEAEEVFALELESAEAAEEPALKEVEESFEELDFAGAVADEEEEGGLEFDLEDFLDDDDDEPKKSGSVDASDIDIDFGD
ncbi:MAG: hypothetical protein GQ556_06505 [Desulfobacterales bacterium]|nr:hypothetical protein [Desulfobacterales bacterium]